MALVIAVFIVFVSQLFNLQVLHGTEYSMKAERFVRKSESLPAARGLIFDRNFHSKEVSIPLVSNSISFDVIVNSSTFKHNRNNIKSFVEYFYSVLGIPRDYYKGILAEPKFSRRIRSRKPIILLRDITREQHERISVFDNLTKKILLVSSPRRIYHLGPALAHVTGYVGKPTKKELNNPEIKPYQLIGKAGLEKQYDNFLRGSDGFRIQKKNSIGLVEDEKIIEDAKMGNNLVLTIDKKMQLSAYKALRRYRGTVIAIKPATGEVLAMVSNPGYDPNVLSGKNRKRRSRHYKDIIKYGGFLNIALQSKFPPASTFKTLVALAALESDHKIDFNAGSRFYCGKSFTLKSTYGSVPDQIFYNWDKKNYGEINLIQAIQHSNSVYFYQLGYKLGSEPILTYSRLFGLDKKTYIDLPGEIEGFVPSSDWKKRVYGNKWFDGDTINLSIGQGFISVTPIGMAMFYMAILNNGKIYQPFVLSEVRDPENDTIIHRTNPRIIRDIPLKASTIASVKKGLRMVVKMGTASSILNKPGLPEISGKTGTAQTRRRGSSSSNHAWFIGYAPSNAPVEEQVLVAVFVEFGVGGAVGAAPIAREIFRVAFPPGSFHNKEDRKVEEAINEELIE